MNLSRSVLHYVKCSIQSQNVAPIHMSDFICGANLCQSLPIGHNPISQRTNCFHWSYTDFGLLSTHLAKIPKYSLHA